ncbi:hypothetical protein SprV_0100174200 [Sparganum proliferum]
MRVRLYATLMDLTKAFGPVNCEGLWKIMQKFGCPERFTHMVPQHHEGMMAPVMDSGDISEAFTVTNGVMQGCVLATTHFSLVLSAMLRDACRDERPGIRIAFRNDGHLNSGLMQEPKRLSMTTVCTLSKTAHSTPRPKWTCNAAWTSSLPGSPTPA